MIKTVQCPGCGEAATFDESNPARFCMSCGHRLFEDTAQISSQMQNYPGPGQVSAPAFQPAPILAFPQGSNLIVSYASEHPRVNMVITFVSTRFRERYVNGTTKAYCLVPGMHAINFTIGKRTYRRDIFISPDGRPVTVQASWRRGVARIAIMNPTAGNIPMTY